MLIGVYLGPISGTRLRNDPLSQSEIIHIIHGWPWRVGTSSNLATSWSKAWRSPHVVVGGYRATLHRLTVLSLESPHTTHHGPRRFISMLMHPSSSSQSSSDEMAASIPPSLSRPPSPLRCKASRIETDDNSLELICLKALYSGKCFPDRIHHDSRKMAKLLGQLFDLFAIQRAKETNPSSLRRQPLGWWRYPSCSRC